MDHAPTPFDTDPVSAEARLAAGLAKLAAALRTHLWEGAHPLGLNPTQGRALNALAGEPEGLRLAAIASVLGVSAPTASDSMAALIRKGLVERGAGGRAAPFRLTNQGIAAADASSTWAAFLERALTTLSPAEQSALNLSLVKIIRALQVAGEIPIARLCVTCRFFRPYAYGDAERPHHCAFVNAAFGNRHLRLDCREHEPASELDQPRLWQHFNQSTKETAP